MGGQRLAAERVIIVGTTRFSDQICIGAVSSNLWDAYRLVPPGRQFWRPNPFTLGGIYDIQFQDAPRTPPHVEDVSVTKWELRGSVANLKQEIESHATVFTGPLEGLFEGKLSIKASNGNLGVAKSNIPSFSTQFWRSDRAFSRCDTTWNQKTNVRFCAGQFSIPYVGAETPPPQISSGSIVRWSLARWFNDICWLQISHVY